MKKLLLLFLGLSIMSCSSDDESDSGRTTDPIIGTWYDADSGGSVTFQSNGRASSDFTGDTCNITFWRAEEENPDFTQVRRYYEWTFICEDGTEDTGGDNEVIFSDDFNRMTVSDFNGVRQ